MSVPHNLRTPVDMWHPQQTGVCDRCGFYRTLVDLPFQYDQRGNNVQNIGLRVCIDRCYDEVATILKPVIIQGPEGVGSPNPRPTHYASQNAQGPSPQLPFTPSNPMEPVTVPEQPQNADGDWEIQGLAPQSYVYGFPGV